MRHENSVFHQLQKFIPWGVFDKLVDEHKADHRVRRLTTRNQFLALLFGQLAGAVSLREIEAGLVSHGARLYHVGARPIARATLADANRSRPAAVFADLFAKMAACAGRKTRRNMGNIHLIDATRIRVSSLAGGWADLVNGKRAIKVHVAFDPHRDAPLSATITGQKTNDILPARSIAIEAGTTYVFDLAYYDFTWWARIDKGGARFVTRMKSHTNLRDAIDNRVETSVRDQFGVLSDRIGYLPERMASSRKNPFQRPLREITVRIQTGKTIRLISNDIDAPAQEIADLYKQRWQIELFFKWIKQNLKIRHFIGHSENAVRIHVYVALIAYMLLRMAQAAQTAVEQPLTFIRLIRLNVMERRSIHQLNAPPKPIIRDQRQLTLPIDGF